ncbi:hypothetical protein PBY51_017278 [Eleginops maclovinus]|uniref:Uncharacterized protein n=1 Tax=Eleginops maclovinus TaxID=56733 RepID=A0AAN7XJE7_ELEMC|nr:hypothetical protein PBY51_017278 [Eleginops maclovinus]
MFVPLPVPFVFQRTASDLNAWRLKSPLALRSNSDLAMQTRPASFGADALAEGKAVGAHTHLHTHSSGSL